MELWFEGVSHTNSVNSTSFNNISDWCPDGVPWIRGQPFVQCISNALQYVAFIIGLTSSLCWLCAQLPQVIQNCRFRRADVALSFWFLLIWILGDVTNLVGAILTHQLATEIVTAVYFVCMDAVLIFQWFYCSLRNQGVKGLIRPCTDCYQHCNRCKSQKSVQEKEGGSLLPAVIAPLALTCFLATSLCALGTMSGVELFGRVQEPSSQTAAGFRGRRLLGSNGQNEEPVVDVTNWQSVLGYTIGCVSGFLYLISRLPQIVKNFRRRSVEGLSFLLFFFAVMGNVTYSLGILMYSVEEIFLLQKLPWLIGSAGTLCLDFTIFVQFCLFGTREDWKRSLCDCGCSRGDSGETQPLLESDYYPNHKTADALRSIPPPNSS